MFNPDNLFWRMISRGVDIVGLSLLWAALSLPIVTCGAATSALYYTIVKCFRHNDRDTFHTFWDSFKSNLKQGLVVSIVSGILLLALAFGYSVMRANWSTQIGQILFVAYDLLMVIPLGTLFFLFPIQGRFSLPTNELVVNSFVLAMKHIFTTIILTLMVVEAVIFTVEYWWPIFFMPVLITLLASFFLEKIFEKYLNEDQKQKFND